MTDIQEQSATLFDKLWRRHIVLDESDDHPAILYIDLHLIHEVTSPQAFAKLEEKALKVRRPDLTFATLDHSTPTTPPDANGRIYYISAEAEQQVEALIENCRRHGITLFGLDNPRRGIVHVIAPELGLTQPGRTIVCGDSHTSTHGAFGALAFGIGTTEVGHVLSTQCVLQRKPKNMRVRFEGELSNDVSAKDLALAMLAEVGAAGGQGFAMEFAGPAIDALSMEGRMTLCNMAIEAGSRFGIIAPDKKTVAWLRDREFAPKGKAFEQAMEKWRDLKTDENARFEKEVTIDASSIQPMITYGVSPDAAAPVTGSAPPVVGQDASDYMKINDAEEFSDIAVDRVFIGSCTNARIEDLRSAAAVLQNRRINQRVKMLIAPGSYAVKAAAEAEGLDSIFISAGADWREPGCSMCIAMNGDRGESGELVVSTSNRNFKGRQGPGVRTVLASPATAAACAVAGRLVEAAALEGSAP